MPRIKDLRPLIGRFGAEDLAHFTSTLRARYPNLSENELKRMIDHTLNIEFQLQYSEKLGSPSFCYRPSDSYANSPSKIDRAVYVLTALDIARVKGEITAEEFRTCEGLVMEAVDSAQERNLYYIAEGLIKSVYLARTGRFLQDSSVYRH